MSHANACFLQCQALRSAGKDMVIVYSVATAAFLGIDAILSFAFLLQFINFAFVPRHLRIPFAYELESKSWAMENGLIAVAGE
eukprot:1148297-Pelagomonas_calceolata.AAC.5